MNRRQFLNASSALIASTAGLSASVHSVAAARRAAVGNELCVFTKPFHSLSFEQLSSSIAAMGFDGIEAPIRPGGHIEPDEVPDRLPELVESLKKQNLRISVLTSDINDPNAKQSRTILETAANLGIRYYRLKYFKYSAGKSIQQQIDHWSRQLKDLAALNREVGITGVYQNHAGRNYFGAPIWDLAEALQGIPPDDLAVAYDIRHAIVEGGTSWPISFQRIQPHVQVVYVKDFRWKEGRPSNVPLGQGRVDSTFFEMLKQLNFDGPISLHEEYLDHRKPELVPKHLKAIEQDLKTLRSWL